MIAAQGFQAPPLPANEGERLQALRALRIVDTPPEERYDRIVRITARVFQVPIAYISFVEEDRQWFKARQGVCAIGGSRDQSFCGHAILGDEPLVIADTHQDARFRFNPMVTGEMGVRFYAGAPIRSAGGEKVGTLCLMDRQSRQLHPGEITLLKELALLVEHELGLVDVVVMQQKVLDSQRELAEEKRKSDELLRNILPEHVAEELKLHGRVNPVLHDEIGVLFSDFTDFTRVSATMQPQELVEELNTCFSAFDHITDRHGVEKLKTIGDGYLCVCGLESGINGHARALLQTAFEMREFVARRQAAKEAAGQPYWNLRIGLHCGPAVAGVVGSRKFAYDIWGDTVNTAARLETAAEPGRINVSGPFLAHLDGQVIAEVRGELPLKGKGLVPQFFVDSWIA
ncbi:MAG: adenylate/guanylate cyclase domain-containing protein [Candidatus Methylacidiphilales bacterium]|nr:adenylate/guanylate cyclase domain-containing protein [Candidatus Methylacidiphilales bacterium]